MYTHMCVSTCATDTHKGLTTYMFLSWQVMGPEWQLIVKPVLWTVIQRLECLLLSSFLLSLKGQNPLHIPEALGTGVQGIYR